MQDVSQKGVAENNRQQAEKAIGLLYQLIQQGLSTVGSKVTEVRLRIPFHGNRLGAPKGSIEKEG